MASLNKVQVIGNLGDDPAVRFMPDGGAVANFSVAVNERWKDKAGNKQERTEWVRCTAWGKLAEICGDYLRKGKQVYVEGRLTTRKWQDKNGQDRYTTEVVLESMLMLGAAPSGERDNVERTRDGNTGTTRPSSAAGGAGGSGGKFDDFEDDIPF